MRLVANGSDALKKLTAFLGNFTYKTGFIVSSGPTLAIRSRLARERVKMSVVGDIFRLEKGKIVEHWDVIQNEVPSNQTVSGFPTFDPAEHHNYRLSACYDEQTETRSMLLAPWGLNKFFNQFDLAVFDKFWDPVYLRHDPGIASGPASLRPSIKANANATAAANLTAAAGAGTANYITGFSLFKFYEHWDVAQIEVPANRTTSGLPMFDEEEFSLQFAY
ncbi:hypothetical protein M427DRAFT_29083 [Gonapodya prolifera JEL478]|uniref:SnoaL-like domain-containing protein n=1 Tax=Gonapodya prolifera (strain JEL478) TaxID=1344416 RepID=A0A139AQR0_GONPJ|nr:hypothetical protein M427DRAFT_29083 [Gonapodya prolifera JEL478]|eukprot:KXS19090.1 hypothetical protein M427DRAFT_29083 [Gonapodya prolifera JEL478]